MVLNLSRLAIDIVASLTSPRTKHVTLGAISLSAKTLLNDDAKNNTQRAHMATNFSCLRGPCTSTASQSKAAPQAEPGLGHVDQLHHSPTEEVGASENERFAEVKPLFSSLGTAAGIPTFQSEFTTLPSEFQRMSNMCLRINYNDQGDAEVKPQEKRTAIK